MLQSRRKHMIQVYEPVTFSCLFVPSMCLVVCLAVRSFLHTRGAFSCSGLLLASIKTWRHQQPFGHFALNVIRVRGPTRKGTSTNKSWNNIYLHIFSRCGFSCIGVLLASITTWRHQQPFGHFTLNVIRVRGPTRKETSTKHFLDEPLHAYVAKPDGLLSMKFKPLLALMSFVALWRRSHGPM